MDGDFNRTIEKDQKIDHKTSKSWTKNQKLTSLFESYISAIQVYKNKKSQLNT